MRQFFIFALIIIVPIAHAKPPVAHAQRVYGVTEVGYPEITQSFFAAPPPDNELMPKAIPQSVAMTAPGVVEIGEPDIDIPFVKHSGIEKTLTEALREILPKDWHAKRKPSVNRYLRISWNKGMDWMRVLNDVAIENRLAISVDWDNKTVTVLNQYEDTFPHETKTLHETKALNALPRETHETNKVFTVSKEEWDEIKPKSGSSKEQMIKAIDKKPIADPIAAISSTSIQKPAQLPPSEPALQLLNGQRMSQSLETWTKKIGWNFIWDAKVDYPISVNTTFTGTPEEIITKFGDAVVHSHLPLHIDVYKQNKTVRISS